MKKKTKQIKREFHRLRSDKNGNSGIDCWVCFKDATWIKQGGGFYCDRCKRKLQKKKKVCSMCGAAL